MKGATRKRSKQLRTPAAALRKRHRDFSSWLEHLDDESERAKKVGRRLLNDAQLREIEEAVDQCRRTAVRSADSRLPANAGKLVREALPKMLGNAENNRRRRPPSRKALKTQRSRLNEAIQATCEMRGMLAELIQIAPFDFVVLEIFNEATEVLARLSNRFEEIRAKGQPAIKTGRRTDVWRSTFLTQLAIYWRRQGWQPTTSHLGAYMTVACLVMGFRRGQDGPVPQVPHSAVTRAWQCVPNVLAMDEAMARIRKLRAAGQWDESD